MASATPTATPTPTSGQSLDATCTTAVPGQYGYVPPDACNALYNYDPSFPAAIAAAAIFGLLTLCHIVEGFVFRKGYTWVVIMGATWETVAFITGALGAHDQQNKVYATVHFMLFFIAPLWINAFVYMSFARVVHFFMPSHRIGPFLGAKMSKYFVLADVVTFFIQVAGGSMASPSADASTVMNGIHIYMAGIGVQEGCILVFLVLMVMFQRQMLAMEKDVSRLGSENGTPIAPRKGWRALLYTLYAVLAAISFRIIYRICEFAKGITASNPIPFHEVYSYALDALPIMLALLLLVIWHPGRTLVGPEAEFPRKTRAEKRAEKQANKEEKRMAMAAKKGQMGMNRRNFDLSEAQQGYHSTSSDGWA